MSSSGRRSSRHSRRARLSRLCEPCFDHPVSLGPAPRVDAQTQLGKDGHGIVGGRAVRLGQTVKLQPVGRHPRHRVGRGQLHYDPRMRVSVESGCEGGEVGHVVGYTRVATSMLALCDMRTLYLRNVPDEVVERLERLAARDRMSVAAVAVRELEEVSRRVDNPVLLGSLPDLGIDAVSVVADLEAGRAER